MMKRCISLFTAICLVWALSASFVFAEEVQPVSADNLMSMPQTVSTPVEQSTEDMVSGISGGAAQMPQIRSFDGTNADGTLDISDGIHTNYIRLCLSVCTGYFIDGTMYLLLLVSESKESSPR